MKTLKYILIGLLIATGFVLLIKYGLYPLIQFLQDLNIWWLIGGNIVLWGTFIGFILKRLHEDN